ncbi:uncharacterized protein HD556DRAFT_1451724 [Suillus plorans]|uniref:Uncharacterized protein n=1 Tax=Suillus plorans TaxID=116603 RepID=A0A9P7A8X2_9AGAM|nr:uncharacterized protein HD556DRAFT_1451724 [Suillus plorans]KAG1784491.1 hypothetical protein HD556DRAFT_1451724 [Suillus plorans]
MDALQWHAHTFDSSSLDDSDWDSDTTNNSYQSDLDFRSHLHRSPSIDSTDSSGPAQYWLDAFLESAVAPEDLPDAYELAMTPEDFISSDPESESLDPETEYDDEELLILNSPDALYQLFLKDKLQVRISASKRWELLCPDCAEWCQTGIHSGINLWISGQFVSLSNHRGSRKCDQTAKKKLSAHQKDNKVFDVPSTCSGVTSNDTSALLAPPPGLNCADLTVVWPDDLRPFTMLLPWERYHEGPDSLPFLVDITHPSKPRVRSRRCRLSTLLEGVPCDECADISQHVSQLAEAARDPKPHTNYRFLGLAHMQDLAKGYADQTRQLKLFFNGLNESRQHMSMLTQLDDYHHLLMAISEQDIPRLQQIINIALHNGASVREIVNKLEDAIEGAYCPRGYGANDLDIATLVFRLGGRQLLFALNQCLGLPSIRTLRTKSVFTKLTPTIGPIRNEQLDENIDSIVLRTRTDITTLRGVSLMVDEIALEEMAIHFSKYNKIAGLCWKHSHLVDPVLHTYESAITITQKIHDGEVHLGKELTVIGATCFGEDELYPILAAPTCKTEDAADMEGVLVRAIERWVATGAAASVGPVWSFATDGDATRRAAGHKLFLKKPLSSESHLYSILSNMPGLNTMTGDAEVMLDFDFKHIFKRFCTLICSPAGIVLNNGRVINTMMLSRYLVWLPAYDEASVMKLLHPDDPQDVPRPLNLVSITLLSNLIESILVPFINTKLSLTEQVQSLSCYAHLAFSIFRVHRHLFMPFQLYYDTQTSVKGVVFNIAKQQLLDLRASFFLGDCGDDRLELMFGRSRMIGGHNSGCSYAQALDRLGAAKDINTVFKRHPELDPGHQRLSLGKRIEDVDHINRLMWKGDIISGHCDLPSVWRQGREMAVAILTSSQIDHINYAYTELFHDPGTDMLRPLGMNKYFGIADEEREDFSRVPKTLPTAPIPLPPSQVFETVLLWLPADESNEIQGLGIDEDDGDKLMLTFEEMLAAESGSDSPQSLVSSTDASAPMPLQGQGIHTDDYLLSYPVFWTYIQQYFHASSRPSDALSMSPVLYPSRSLHLGTSTSAHPHPDPFTSVHQTSIPLQLACIIHPLSYYPNVISRISTLLIRTSDPIRYMISFLIHFLCI